VPGERDATGSWHHVDLLDGRPDEAGLDGKLTSTPASQGPARDCMVNKIAEFQLKLAHSATSAAERLLARFFCISSAMFTSL